VTGPTRALKASQAIEKQADQAINQASAIERKNAVGIGSAKTVNGLRLVHVARNAQHTQLREATTGRPVMVPRIWAVAETSPVAGKQPTPVAEPQPVKPQPKVELAFYRKYTEAMLRRYLRVSTEVGRVPSVMDRELFRGKASHYKLSSFEDGVIFSVDVERCLAKLRKSNLRLIERIALQGYTPQEAAPFFGLQMRRCYERYGQALDQLTELFLATRLLEPLKSCQDVETA
jgi:DNA-directed RNA polymerase specialized sigma24 family protein